MSLAISIFSLKKQTNTASQFPYIFLEIFQLQACEMFTAIPSHKFLQNSLLKMQTYFPKKITYNINIICKQWFKLIFKKPNYQSVMRHWYLDELVPDSKSILSLLSQVVIVQQAHRERLCILDVFYISILQPYTWPV